MAREARGSGHAYQSNGMPVPEVSENHGLDVFEVKLRCFSNCVGRAELDVLKEMAASTNTRRNQSFLLA